MGDGLIRAMTQDRTVRALAAVTTVTVDEARSRHGTLPTATAALGRALTAASLLGAMLKGDQTVTLRILGDGPLGGIVAWSDALGHVRGYVAHPLVDLPLTNQGKLNVGAAVGKGTLHVTKDLGLRYPYHGSVPLSSGEIAEDLARYFAISEQIPSAVALGVLVAPDGQVLASGGLVVQLLPGADEEVASYLEQRARALPAITSMVYGGHSPKELVEEALGELPFKIIETRAVSFRCSCDRQKVEETLLALGEEELKRLHGGEDGAEVLCRFCRKQYRFSQEDLDALLAQIRSG
ncbi:MAG: Hsp33 family molecular chaperone HslO [Armatimonadota bacterium]|nr:Hsp33 family molecular chaperone HslO [Armatimonadota bacterium]MDR5703613.1 Hsp33 family molecular chaperone HslO [Armatimonadota bacterium]MDR7435161.1 Hsp33 family molecular chaperone HslO [Armatimonadota bacterium]